MRFNEKRNTRREEEKNMSEKTFQQVCRCENCGNEAEMQVTCSLDIGQKVVSPVDDNKTDGGASSKEIVKGRSVCSHCGNEADMWVEVE